MTKADRAAIRAIVRAELDARDKRRELDISVWITDARGRETELKPLLSDKGIKTFIMPAIEKVMREGKRK